MKNDTYLPNTFLLFTTIDFILMGFYEIDQNKVVHNFESELPFVVLTAASLLAYVSASFLHLMIIFFFFILLKLIQ